MKLDCCKTAWRVGIFLAGAAICLGCAPDPNVKDRFVPAADLARRAVDEVLVDWQAGRAPGPIDRLAVGVQVVDKQRKKGQSLEEYEILGEAPGDAGRCFAVRVKLDGPAAEENVRFVVIGIDPLWVFRQEDYESVSQWACGKPEEEPPKPSGENGDPNDDHLAAPATPSTPNDDAPRESLEPSAAQDESCPTK